LDYWDKRKHASSIYPSIQLSTSPIPARRAHRTGRLRTRSLRFALRSGLQMKPMMAYYK
jgi:hypothetical protein